MHPAEGSYAIRRWVQIIPWSFIILLGALRFFHLSADFPDNSPWLFDQAKFTDEGWWAQAAILHHLTGHWYSPGDYNPALAVPLWPAMLAVLYHFTGVSLLATRALTVVLSLATLPLVFLLVRRYTVHAATSSALFAVALLAASPFAYAFSRLAILDTFVIFQFCLLLLTASSSKQLSAKSILLLATQSSLLLLTKTTAALLIPAVACMPLIGQPRTQARILRTILAWAIIPSLLLAAWAALTIHLGFGPDRTYFFTINAMPAIVWSETLPVLRNILRDARWIDPILYPAAVLAIAIAITKFRSLWTNPLFTASCAAILLQAAFLFHRQDDYAPRYFLPLLVPVIFVVVLTTDQLSLVYPKLRTAAFAVLALALALDVATVLTFMRHRTTRFVDAADSIRSIVRSDPIQHPLLLGVSASQLSLMTAIPSINDVYGVQPLPQKILRYRPGWYVAWNGIDEETRATLAPFLIQQVAAYPVFDDDERNLLILYRLALR